jgi:hypothetical protein
MLRQSGFRYETIPFRAEEFVKLANRARRVVYLTNVNQARNTCINAGLEAADWVLPLDGGCFVRFDGWQEFVSRVDANPDDAYFALPTLRLRHHCDATAEQRPSYLEVYRLRALKGREIRGISELMIAFSRSSDCHFNERLVYGRLDKVELLWRLGINGPWDNFVPWRRPAALKRTSRWAGRVKIGGLVCRLPSGNAHADQDVRVRYQARLEGIRRIVDERPT